MVWLIVVAMFVFMLLYVLVVSLENSAYASPYRPLNVHAGNFDE